MMKRNLTIFIILITIISCLNKDKDSQEKNDNSKGLDLDLKNEKCSNIIISYYETTDFGRSSWINYKPFTLKTIHSANKAESIDKFNSILKNSTKTGYCCCPEKHYIISFYDKSESFKSYYVDTVSVKNKVRIFEPSYQYSYMIEKNTWLNYLSKIDTVGYRELRLYGEKEKREFYKYCQLNNLPIVISNTSSKNWMKFEGFFYCKYSSIGEYLDEEKLTEKFKKAYPKDFYEIETASRFQMCGENKGMASFSFGRKRM